MQKILLLDSTLREGEQAPRITLAPEQRLLIAQALDQFGVDFIEISPIVSPAHGQTMRDLMALGLRADIVAHCRASTADIDVALDAGARWVALFLSTSDVHLESKLHMTRERSLQIIDETVSYAKAHGLKVRFTCEDASRTPTEQLLAACRAAQNAGADRLGIPDTVGLMTPSRMGALISSIRQHISTPLDLHCHNDLGLALANTLAGLEAGATCAHVSINGVGERCGITSLAELVMALRVLYNAKLSVRTDMLCSLSQMLSSSTGVITDEFAPVVGENAFRHKGGTHLAAVLSNSACYEAFPPESVGNRRRLVLGDYSGKNMVRFLSGALGMQLDDKGVERALRRLKQKNGDLLDFEL